MTVPHVKPINAPRYHAAPVPVIANLVRTDCAHRRNRRYRKSGGFCCPLRLLFLSTETQFRLCSGGLSWQSASLCEESCHFRQKTIEGLLTVAGRRKDIPRGKDPFRQANRPMRKCIGRLLFFSCFLQPVEPVVGRGENVFLLLIADVLQHDPVIIDEHTGLSQQHELHSHISLVGQTHEKQERGEHIEK